MKDQKETFISGSWTGSRKLTPKEIEKRRKLKEKKETRKMKGESWYMYQLFKRTIQ